MKIPSDDVLQRIISEIDNCRMQFLCGDIDAETFTRRMGAARIKYSKYKPYIDQKNTSITVYEALAGNEK